MNDSGPPKPKLRWYQFSLRTLLLMTAAIALLLSPLSLWVRNRPRVLAKSYLCRNQRTFALLDTWRMTPNEVLKAYPPSKTIIGTRKRGPRWVESVVGIYIINARLAGPGVDDTDLTALESFPEIEYLELVDTNVTDSGIRDLQKALPDLQIVRRSDVQVKEAKLFGPCVDDATLSTFKRYPKLEYLELVDTNVTDLGVQKLQKALPNLRIVRR